MSVLAACRQDPENNGEFPRAETLFAGGLGWVDPSSFNPLLSTPSWPSGSNLVYETLFDYDLKEGRLAPLLAESYTVFEDSIEVVLNPAAHFSDGRPVTGCDVAYSYELGRQYRSLSMAPTWQYLSAIRLLDVPERACETQAGGAAPTPRKLRFELNPARRNPLVVLDGLITTRIVPKHEIEPALAASGHDLLRFNQLKFDHNPIGSGPYRLHSYSGEKIVLMRDPEYWGNRALHAGRLPAPKFIVAPIYKSNDHFSIGLQQGRIDISSSFVPRIWLKAKKGVRAWYDQIPFFPPSAIAMFYVNLQRQPLGDLHLRRAMAHAINYTDIAELAVSGYSVPLKPGLILPFGVEARYYSEQDARRYGAGFDPERAKAELRAGGYRPIWNQDGELLETRDAQDARLPTLHIKCVAGWTDWESILRIAVKSMRKVGIDVRERMVDSGSFFAAWYSGDFDLLIQTPNPPQPLPSKPWSRFESVLTAGDWAPEGEKMYKNQGRFNRPGSPEYVARFEELLALIPRLSGEEELTQAYRELNRLTMQLQPTLPVVYRPFAFYEFSSRVWKGFPTADHPYLPPQIPGDGLGTRMLWHLQPVSSQ